MQRTIRQFLAITFLVKAVVGALGQEPSFIHYSVDEGLPSNLIYSMTQDKEGFMWFGTDKGLARFDGQRFHVFGIEDGLPDTEILQIKSDSKGRLWISPFKQNPCFWQNGVFHTSETDSMLRKIHQKSSLFNFQEDHSGRIWMYGGERAAFCIDGNQVTRVEFSIAGISRWLFQADSQEYMINLGSINRLKNGKEDEVALDLFGLIDNPYSQAVSGINVVNNLLLFCISNKLILIKYENKKFQVLDTMSDVTGQVYATSTGEFVVTTFNQGAIFFDCSKGKIVRKRSILPDKKVNMVFEDDQGTLWFCTPDEGVYALPEHAPQNYISTFAPNSSNITFVTSGEHKEIIAGNDEGGMFVLQNDKMQYINLGSSDGSNRILKIIQPESGKLMIASDENVFGYQQNTVTTYPFTSTPKSIVYNQGQLWMATAHNVGFLSLENQQYFLLRSNRFTAIEADPEGYIWAGGMNGLFSNLDSFLHNWGEDFPLLKSRIITLCWDKRGYMWVSTPSNGLLRVSTASGRVTSVERLNDLISTSVQNVKTIFVDEYENVWMGTNKGVYMLRPDLSCINFDRHDGLLDNDINSLVVVDNTLWAGTTKGLTKLVLEPDAQKDPFPTYVVGVQYRLDDKQHNELFLNRLRATETVLPPDARLLEIQLAGLDYASRGNIRYQYVQRERFPPLPGLTLNNLISLIFSSDKSQPTIITENSLNLGARLRPGKYEFEFIAMNSKGERSKEPAVFHLVQQAYWYETFWFWLGIWWIVAFGLMKLYQNRMAYRDLNASVSKLRLQALQVQMNPHFIGNSIYAIQQFFYPPDPEKASEYIELFNRLFRQSLNMAERHFVTFQEDLNYYRDYLDMIQLRLGDRFVYHINGVENIPPNLPYPAMILQPIIENATIHGLALQGQSILTLAFELKGSSIQTTIEDNGEGIAKTRARKEGTPQKSKGTQLIQQRINTLNKLYNLQMQLLFEDLSEVTPNRHGTRATLVYNYEAIDPQETQPGK